MCVAAAVGRKRDMMIKTLLTAGAGVAAMLAVVAQADAQSRDRGERHGYVTTCSTYGNGCTQAPVRRGRNGYEFQLPGGTWVECRRNCQNALREDSVDFWETQRENQPR
jgi:hypothetical protein